MDLLKMQPRRAAALLGALLCLSACSSKPKDITESRAEYLAGQVMESYCGEGKKDGKCTDFFAKGQVPPTDPRFKWAFKYFSEFTDPQRIMIVLVGRQGETSVMLEDVPVGAGGAPGAAASEPAREEAR
ncbi:MAG: hypothetical protein HY923_01935 [Elusimicrobia bacterium]|nr:hypothetical protein [Elusimicrobiota bacterium]